MTIYHSYKDTETSKVLVLINVNRLFRFRQLVWVLINPFPCSTGLGLLKFCAIFLFVHKVILLRSKQLGRTMNLVTSNNTSLMGNLGKLGSTSKSRN